MAARFVKNCYEQEPGTVTNLLNDFNWHSLEMTCKIARVTTMYKIVNNKIGVNIPEYNTTNKFQKYLECNAVVL